MDRLDELAIFVAGSLAGAARRLRRSTAAVTRALAALEKRAGARLIDRTTRRLSVTASGRALAERARTLTADYASALGDVAEGQTRGLLRVTAPTPFGRRWVAPIVADFLAAHALASVELVLDDRNLDMIEQAIDVAVRIGELADSSLRVRRVGVVTTVLVASPAYLAAHGAPGAPTDLAEHATIFGTSRAGLMEWRFGPGCVVFPVVEEAAHAADLGMTFYSGHMFPAKYKGAIFSAQHGSWNRTEPVGARVMVTFVGKDGKARSEPFAEGWLDQDGAYLGRPVDVAQMRDGSLLVSDDQAGALYRITYDGKQAARAMPVASPVSHRETCPALVPTGG